MSAPPSAATAEVLFEGGTVFARFPLTDGAGSGPFPSTAPCPAHVRVLDANGEVVGKAPAMPEIQE